MKIAMFAYSFYPFGGNPVSESFLGPSFYFMPIEGKYCEKGLIFPPKLHKTRTKA